MSVKNETMRTYRVVFACMLAVGAAVHAYVSQSAYGFSADMVTFASWGRRMAEVGAARFYGGGYWCDYPPGYIVVLGLLHSFADALNANEGTALWLIIVKSPACICDCATAWIIWRIASRSLADASHGLPWALGASAAYLFNPVPLIDSALWGQVDSVLAFFIVAMFACYLRAFECAGIGQSPSNPDGAVSTGAVDAASARKRSIAWMVAGSALWAIGITCKLQGVLIAPAVLIAFLLLIRRDVRTGLMAMGLSAAAALCVALIVLVPFSRNIGMAALLQIFLNTLGSYQLGSVNALNFFTMVGAGWADQELPFLGLTYRAWGTIFLVLLVLFVFACYVRFECDAKRQGTDAEGASHTQAALSARLVALPILLAAVLVVGFFTFSVRVHERYMFYAVALLLLAAVLYRDWYLAFAFVLVSAIGCINLITVYNGAYFFGNASFDVFMSASMVVTCIFLLGRTWQLACARYLEIGLPRSDR